jgi:chemotaxis response regulator CheB
MSGSMDAKRDIVVIGASSGGVDALTRLVAGLPPNLPAAVHVVQHTGPGAPGLLGQILDRVGPLPVRMAVDGEPFAFGEIRVAPPDHHLLLTTDGVRLDRGPIENRVRPAIDVLFRSAAIALGSRVIGVVLTGNLSDGAAGLRAIKQCGGISLVQAPEDALYPDMPRNAIRNDHPDAVLPLEALADEIAPYVRGHAMPVDVPAIGKSDELTRALGYAMRALDEKSLLLERMVEQHRSAKRHTTADICERKRIETVEAAAVVRRLLESLDGAADG